MCVIHQQNLVNREEFVMFDEQGGDALSISYLNALEYCPRRFYYECALSEFLDNAHVAEGTMRHERSDSGRTTTEDGTTTLRRVWVWSDRLRLSGFADVVEESEGKLLPIEYKKGKMGEWLNDHVQLCAQALCLEEMLNCTIPLGYIFYFGSARREEVIFYARTACAYRKNNPVGFYALRAWRSSPAAGWQTNATQHLTSTACQVSRL
jgi:CRISPR-associated exonuclease Cas4